MQILKVKTQADFDAAVVPIGTLLVFPERQSDNSYVWKYKDSSGNEGTLGAEPGNASGITCAAGTGVAVGMLVYLADVDGTLTCLPADFTSHPADACVIAISGEEAVLAQNGIIPLASGLAPGTELFLGSNGSFTGTAPAASGEIVQKVGRVIDADTVFFNIQPGRIIV
jgi:hypothetical protein